VAQKWATGGKACASNTYPKGKVQSFADGGFVEGLTSGALAGYNMGKDRKKKAAGTTGTTGTTGTETAASSTDSSALPTVLKPEGTT
jgi:hypothetical protein